MKILFLSYDIGLTASGIISERILRELINQGNEVVVITQLSFSKDITGCRMVEIPNCLKENTFLSRLWNKIISYFFYPFNSNFIWRLRTVVKAIGILNMWKPDCIYCRTSPTDPLFVGICLKYIYNIPLISNLTDPLPPPIEYIKNTRVRNQLTKQARKIIKNSDLLAMGTEQAIIYQQRITGLSFSNKVFVSPDPVPFNGLKIVKQNKSQRVRLLYLGAIYGSRNIYPLLEAIKLLRDIHFNIVLDIFGPIHTLDDKYQFVKQHKFATNLDEIISDSDILVDLDGDDSEPVFVSSKLKQYIVYNRPILSITPLGSPSSKLLKDLVTVCVVQNNKLDISDCLKVMIGYKYVDNDYIERLPIIHLNSSKSVVDNLLSKISSIN